MRFLEQRPDVGLASGVMLKHGSSTVHCAGGHFTLGGVFRMNVLMAGRPHRGNPDRPYTVGYIPGAMVFARTDFLRELRGFREDFFMYFDDVELCARVSRMGRPLMIVPTALAYHFEPPSGPVPAYVNLHKVKNFLALYLLHAPWRVLPEFFARYVLLALARGLCGSPYSTWLRLRAFCLTLAGLPALLRDRHRLLARAGERPTAPK
jgi:GT2 family glycosyltransferase